MPTLTVTKTTGGKTKPMLMTVAAPSQRMTPDQLKKFGGISAINGASFADLLSSFAAHERCGAHLYRTLAGMTTMPEMKQKYEEYGRETAQHITIYEDLIRELGGDPQYVSPQARMTEFMANQLMEPFMFTGSVDMKTTELAGIEALVLAETKCHANWSLLSKLVQQLPDGKAKQAIKKAVDQVEPQEDQHIRWAKSAWEQLAMQQLTQR